MTALIIGILLLASIFSLFYLKNYLQSPLLSRIAYSDLIMRFSVIAVGLIFVGIVIIISKVLP